MGEPIIYWGEAEALQAEIGLQPCYGGPYVVVGFGPNGEEYTPESGISSRSGAKAMAEELAAAIGASAPRFVA